VPRRPVTPTVDIAALEQLSLVELRSRWAEHFGAVPALRSPDLLRLILAWRLQARKHGGLDPAIRRKVKRTGPALAEGLRLGPGTRLKREWDDRTEEILVEKNGFRWRGNSYPSLSAIALAMTGTRRNGPRFFGLRGKSR
jgi:hypothetical protein